MRIRTTILAAAIAALPAFAIAQTAMPDAGSATRPTTSSAAATGDHHHSLADRQKRHAEMRQKYEQLSAADKAKYDEIGKQIRDLHQQRMQILGLKKS